VPSTTDLSEAVEGLAVLAARELRVVWARVDTADLARQALRDLLPALIQTYGLAAATLAADWYDDYRLQSEVAGSFSANPSAVTDSGAEALAGWGVSPLYQASPDWLAAEVLVAGGLQRRIANASRQTVVESSLADPAAIGWQRIGQGTSCAFCQMLIARGAVYSEATADFASHDHCNCAAAPAWGGRARTVKPYTPTGRNITDKDRARVRAYLKANPGA
jgi:hypothetical protein